MLLGTNRRTRRNKARKDSMREGIFVKLQGKGYPKTRKEMESSEKSKYLFYIKNNGHLIFWKSQRREQVQHLQYAGNSYSNVPEERS